MYHAQPLNSLTGNLDIPGDKSTSHRIIMFGSLATGITKVRGLLEGEDVMSTIDAFRAMGVTIEKDHTKNEWIINGVGLHGLTEPNNVLNMGNSGTTTRLISGILSAQKFNSFLTGDDSLITRPMARISDPLTQMEGKFILKSKGRLPMVIQGNPNLKGIEYELPHASAQVKSAILLAGLYATGSTTVKEPIATRSYTEDLLRMCGASIKSIPYKKGFIHTIEQCKELTAPKDVFNVPADPSSCAFPVVAGLICKDSKITIKNVDSSPTRFGIYDILLQMGANIIYTNKRTVANIPLVDMEISFSELTAVEVDSDHIPSMVDEVPVLAVACAYAKGTSIINGLKELRVKESDRLQGTLDMLLSAGVKAEIVGDSLHITGTNNNVQGGGEVMANLDHRMAMSGIVLSSASKDGMEIDDVSPIQTSFPNFFEIFPAL